jgi:hypothetical protein
MISSSKAGIASDAGRLLNEINIFIARGASGNRLVIKVCRSAPQLCPKPITDLLNKTGIKMINNKPSNEEPNYLLLNVRRKAGQSQ